MTGRSGEGGVGGAGEVTVLVSRGEGRGAAGAVETLSRRWRVEGGGVWNGIPLPVVLLLILLCEPLPVLRLKASRISAPHLPAGILLISVMC